MGNFQSQAKNGAQHLHYISKLPPKLKVPSLHQAQLLVANANRDDNDNRQFTEIWPIWYIIPTYVSIMLNGSIWDLVSLMCDNLLIREYCLLVV